jgi:RNA polymerase sigma factor (sigma-70 family)
MSSDGFDEAACLRRVRERDEAACRELVEHLYPAVIRIVRAHRPRRDAEEDLAQEVFMKMFSRLDQYRERVPLEHWISRIAVTTCYDKLRAQQRAGPSYAEPIFPRKNRNESTESLPTPRTARISKHLLRVNWSGVCSSA